MAVLLLLVLAVAVKALPYATLDEGDACATSGGGRGECRRVTQCLSALDAIRRGARDASSRRCGFLGWEEVVCCPLRDLSPQPSASHAGSGGGVVQGGRWGGGGVGGGGGGGDKDKDRRRPLPIGNSRTTSLPPTRTIVHLSTTLLPPSTAPPAFFGRTQRPGVESTKPGGRSGGKARKACERYRRIEEQRISSFILGGEEAAEGEFPHMVALGYLRKGQKKISWRCGGTLISEEYVLTAAHCITDEFAGAPKMVRVGQVDLRTAAGTTNDYRVDSWTLHPRYKRKFNYDDVALLRLAAPVSFSLNVRPACLPQPSTQREQSPRPLRGDLTATGWGATQAVGAVPSPLLLKTNVSEVAIDECRSLHRTAPRIPQGISSDMLCAGDPKGLSDTCVGDSGGPLQVLEEPRSAVHTVVGITSFGPGPCGGKKPGVYVRVANYVPWIESIVWP